MAPDPNARRTIAFVNLGHALDHFLLLIYPTAVIAIAAESGLAYGELIGLSTGAFVAFGVLSLPMGWLAARFGRRSLFAAFLLGGGAACLGMAFSGSPLAFAFWLTVLGAFAAIYHPIGSTMLVANAERLGRALGVNGVWGNLGAALASGITGLIAALLGWRAAFAVPGLVCLAAGVAFLALVPDERARPPAAAESSAGVRFAHPLLLFMLFAVAVVAGGLTFNFTTIALPKVIDERLGTPLPLWLTGSLATTVFVLGALMQLAAGRLVDRLPLPTLFLALSTLQPLGLGLAALTTGLPMLVGLALAMSAIYGQVVVNDAMIARFVPGEWRARAFSIRYFLGFTTSGFAVPMIAILHGTGGFVAVLAVAAAAGLAIFGAALALALLARPAAPELAAAE
ncbi:MFS transporter [Propylenella binzhouense]|uniref:MFS transporter n=1 Tax=Propylenella binzhouense TaxID=2555902 RepID=A0A964T6P4_9HYPH|nr:MFS transporter [Propylenella binzhouense]MYZ49541.1 MFS transporter [Propylenella binzhouense]